MTLLALILLTTIPYSSNIFPSSNRWAPLLWHSLLVCHVGKVICEARMSFLFVVGVSVIAELNGVFAARNSCEIPGAPPPTSCIKKRRSGTVASRAGRTVGRTNVFLVILSRFPRWLKSSTVDSAQEQFCFFPLKAARPDKSQTRFGRRHSHENYACEEIRFWATSFLPRIDSRLIISGIFATSRSFELILLEVVDIFRDVRRLEYSCLI